MTPASVARKLIARIRTWKRIAPRTYEPAFSETAVIWDALRTVESGTMIDVGAHQGSAHQEYLDDGWSVFAFEPDPDNRSKLKRHPGLRISSYAVGAQNASGVSFFTSHESTGVSSLSSFTTSHQLRCTVTVRTLETLVTELEIGKCDYLKIDAEGHDLFVLQGTPWTRIKPLAIMCEFEDRKTIPLGYTYRDLADLLVGHGYSVFMSEWAPIVRYGTAHTWRRVVRYPATTLEPNAWGNFLAFAPGVKLPDDLSRHLSA